MGILNNFRKGQKKPKMWDRVMMLEDQPDWSAGKLGEIQEIHPRSGEVIIKFDDDDKDRYIAYRDDYEIIGDDGIHDMPPEIEDEDDLIIG